MPKWTENQLDAIESRDGTILVSAAAGSGKTAVLVERAIRRLTVGENPSPADKLLVVTFTKAAAAEMRARLEKELNRLVRENPQNYQLQRQSVLLSQANIGTAHSFCADLIRENFHALDIPPDFKIITDNQEQELRMQVVSDVLDECFEGDEFNVIADAFTEERSDRRLTEIILSLYTYMQSHPFPEKWLKEKSEMYRQAGKVSASPWGKVILDYTCEAAEYARLLTEEAAGTCLGEEIATKAFSAVLETDLENIGELCKLAELGTWDEISAAIKLFKFPQKGRTKTEEQGSFEYIKCDMLREEVKKTVKSLGKFFESSEKDCEEEFTEIAAITEKLSQLVIKFSQAYSEQKLSMGFLDYGDLEHYTLKLLVDENGKRSEFADSICERYDEIMVDEYQDVNEVQNLIFGSLSRDGQNLFMVGDVKQSIYRFRCAEPEIFINSKERFEKFNRELNNYPAYVVLDRNFRSREQVTQSVNFVFSQIMSKESAETDYSSEEELVYGADFPQKESGCETELIVLEKQKDTPDEELEARYIAEKIKKIIASGMTIKNKQSGAERPVRYGDFAILMRSANSYAHSYAQVLFEHDIPAKATVAGDFFEAQEVRVMMSLLRVIDNPNQDVPLLAVMMSPIYGFTPDDMARLRLEDKRISVYLSLVKMARNDERYKAVLSEIEEFRAIAATMPSDAFISYLYQRTGYSNMVLAMPDGEQRLANLHLLERYARDYEASGYNGIGGFVRFTERLKSNRGSMQSAELALETSSSVQIMSIHKSKGLEFPICIVAGCGRGGSNRKDEVLLHPELGLGIKIRDNSLGARYTTMPREAISLDSDRRDGAEELRILYVAMTRAREKLILLGTLDKPEQKIATFSAQITRNGITPYTVRNSSNFMQLLLLCALRHPDAFDLRAMVGAEEDIVYKDHYTPWSVEITSLPELLEVAEEDINEIAVEPDMELVERLKENLSFAYPFAALEEIPAKVTASGLVSRELGRASEQPLSRPSWLGKAGMTPAERGTALHNYMQYADFKSAAANPKEELERLVREEFLTSHEAETVDFKQLEGFFISSLGKRVLASNHIEKEKRFTVEIDAGTAMPELKDFKDEKIILQGAVDCMFLEDDKLHIVDFKTDNVSSAEELVEIYATQLRLYAQAMGQISGYEVGECYLYSMKTGEYVSL